MFIAGSPMATSAKNAYLINKIVLFHNYFAAIGKYTLSISQTDFYEINF